MTENVNEVEKNTEETPSEQAASPDLNIQDLSAMKVIIDIASQRGAFKPNEMAVVGQTYNKLVAFLDHISKQTEEAKANG